MLWRKLEIGSSDFDGILIKVLDRYLSRQVVDHLIHNKTIRMKFEKGNFALIVNSGRKFAPQWTFSDVFNGFFGILKVI